MSADLDTALDARDLVPGDPGVLNRMADVLGSYGADLGDAARAFGSLGPGSWSGPAADAFRARFLPEPHRWSDAADAFAAAARAVHVHATSLLLAQDDVADALARYRRVADSPARMFVPVGALHPATSPADELVEAQRRLAESAVEDARARVRVSGTSASHAVRAAAARAPAGPSWRSRLADSVAAFGADLARLTWNGAVVPMVNGAVSASTAASRDPGTTLALVGGALLTVVGAAGDATGVTLSGTGVGAVAGVPLTVAGCAVVATGVVVTGGAAARLTYEAQQQQVQVLHRVGPAADPSAPTPDADRIDARLRQLPRGIQKRNREVANEGELSELWDELSADGAEVPTGEEGRRLVTFPDGSSLGWRSFSGSGGDTMDFLPARGKRVKVHLQGSGP